MIMTTIRNPTNGTLAADDSPRRIVIQAGAALAVSMGIGRFVYTPILPLMHSQAGLSAQFGSMLATANYIGYLLGALAGIFIPAAIRSMFVLRTGLVVVVATLVLMGLTQNHAEWFALRPGEPQQLRPVVHEHGRHRRQARARDDSGGLRGAAGCDRVFRRAG